MIKRFYGTILNVSKEYLTELIAIDPTFSKQLKINRRRALKQVPKSIRMKWSVAKNKNINALGISPKGEVFLVPYEEVPGDLKNRFIKNENTINLKRLSCHKAESVYKVNSS